MHRVLRALFGRTETALAAAIVATAIVFSVTSPYFLTMPNLVDLVEAYSVTTILAAGVFVVLVSGGIDISFTATASAAQYLAAYLIVRQGVPAVPALAVSALLGIALGSINALLTYHLRVVSIIVTIATASIYYALLIYFTNAEEIYNLPDWWSNGISFWTCQGRMSAQRLKTVTFALSAARAISATMWLGASAAAKLAGIANQI